MNDSGSRGVDAVGELFVRHFGAEPVAVASAPGRVNLIGEHTDYNGGEVLPIGIRQRTFVAVRPTGPHHSSRAVSASANDIGTFDHRSHTRTGGWWDYVIGVARQLERVAVTLPPFDIAVTSSVPVGAGLSSSAALEVATAVALLAMAERELPLREVALLGQRAEAEFVGVASGVMDQFASTLARESFALHLWCDSLEIEHVAMRDSVLIFDTGVARSLRDSAFNARRRECERALALLRRVYPELPHLAAATTEQVRDMELPGPLDRRALHIVEETRRVAAAVEALNTTGHLPGDLLFASHESLATQYECSIPELDWFVEHAAAYAGVRGARLTGAGWGGCAIAIGDPDALAAAALILTREYAARFDCRADAWITGAAGGVRTEEPVT